MPNEFIASLIAQKLRTGLVYPGDKARGIKAQTIMLPFAARAGVPQEYSDLQDATVRQMAEAIVSIIETDGASEIVPRDEIGALRLATGEAPPDKRIPIYCRCNRETPLAVLSMTTPDRIVLDGRSLLRELAKKSADHPHGPVTK